MNFFQNDVEFLRGIEYNVWYTDGRESRIHTAILIVNKGRIALTTPDMGILPTLRETI